MTMPSRVLIIVRPSAPASRAASAIVTMSVTSGVSLAKIGVPAGSRSRTSRTTRSDDSGSQAKTSPRLATLGHEMLTSTPTTASKAGLPASRSATSPNSSAVLPAIETSTRAPTDASQARSFSTKASMPGPCRPIELSMPDAVSAIRGVPRPERGARHDRLGDEGAELGDREEAVQLLAVGRAAGCRHHRVGQRHRPQRGRHVDHQWPPARGAPRASSGTRPMPSPNASQRTRSPRNTGPSTQERTIRVTPSLPVTGRTQVMQTPTPQAIDSSTATWATAPWAVAMSVTERSIAIGPQP